MKRELRRWEIVGFIATGLFGTLLHFVYEWTGGNRVIAVFSAVNESTWEHMKLLFIPFLVFTVVEFIVFSEAFRNFFAVKAASILLGLVSIPALFYTLTGMFGKLPDWVNITIFFHRLGQLLRPASTATASMLNCQAFRTFFQIDSFPVLYSFVPNFKSLCRFTIPKFSFQHCFYHQLLEFWCVFLVWHSF